LAERQMNQIMYLQENGVEVVNYQGKYFYLHPEYGYVELEKDQGVEMVQPQRVMVKKKKKKSVKSKKSRFYEMQQDYNQRELEAAMYEEQMRKIRSMDNMRKVKTKKKKKTVNGDKKMVNNYMNEGGKVVRRKKKITNKKKTKAKSKARKDKDKENMRMKSEKKIKKSKKKRKKTVGKKKINKRPKSVKQSKKKLEIYENIHEEKIPEVQNDYEQLYNEKSYEVVTGYEENQGEFVQPKPTDNGLSTQNDEIMKLEENGLLYEIPEQKKDLVIEAPEPEAMKDTGSFREEEEYENKLLSMGR
jgi:hypothetical protein